MHIGMLSPISWCTPPEHYGPWEWVVSMLTEGLVESGVKVTLFATGNSHTGAKLRWVCPNPYSEDPNIDPKVWESLHISSVFEHADEFDLIHNHFDFLPLSYSKLVNTPMLTTIHGFSSPKILPVYRKYNNTTHYVSISYADRSPDLDYLANIYHGIPVGDYPFSNREGEYLLALGRIHGDKGVHEAIQVARKGGMPLRIAGIIQDKAYYDHWVAPYVDGVHVVYMGIVSNEKKKELLKGAYALLHMINFDEPFGLTVIEAMATGTPVIAVRRGSMPEVMADGETGWLVSNVEEAVEKLISIKSISRTQCRNWVISHFSSDRMVNEYICAYKEVLSV